MEKRITYMQSNGILAFVIPAYKDALRPVDESEDELITRVAAKSIPAGVSYTVIDETDIPTDRSFRDAWEQDSVGKPVVNMPKARIIHKDRIRVARDIELNKLDIPFMRAIETKDSAEEARITTLKQALRDIPEAFDLASYATPDALKTAWPSELPQPKG